MANCCNARTHPLRDLVNLSVHEVEAGIEVVFAEGTLPNQLVRHLTLDVHHVLEHLIIRLARKHYLTRVQFVQRYCHRPHVDLVIVRHAKDCKEAMENSTNVLQLKQL